MKSVLILMFCSFFTLSVYADVLGYFKESYEASRAQFIATGTDSHLENYFTIKHTQYHQPFATNFITDVIYLRSKSESKGLLVINSGIHGIEGFAGSAVQAWLLDEIEKVEPTHDYVFIHAFNPYGFKNKRRVDFRNVDLNRAIMFDVADYETKNPEYGSLNKYLNPSSKVELGIFSRVRFIFSSLFLIVQHSIDSLRKAILVGQYEFPQGLYYGGGTIPYQAQMLSKIESEIFSKYEKIFVIDLHTGYGENGKLHLLANSKKSKKASDLKQIFGEARVDFGDSKNFYAVKGDLITFLESKATEKQTIIGATFEYGTLDSQKTMGSIESLRRMILENQKFNHGSDKKTASEVDSLFSEMFYPSSTEWRAGIISQTETELKKVSLYLQANPAEKK